MAYDAFLFEGYDFDRARSGLSLRYRYDGGPRFEETLVFDIPRRRLSAIEETALDRIFRLILLFSGVSYFKAFVPPRLVCDAFALDRRTAEFVREFYEKGLAEFAYRNKLSLAGRIAVESGASTPPAAVALDLPRGRPIVTLECLKRAGEPVTLFSLGDAEPIAATIAASGLPFVRVRRRLDPALFALNAAGAYNGHVPITGILSAIALAAAVLCGARAVVMSNEHSANAPTLVACGAPVNHQWSKSLEFETALAQYLEDCIARGLDYFSLLRPLSEIEIARRFARLPQYFGVFRSCNTAFRQSREARGKDWCGACPKCRFVFLALAPFVEKPDLIAIFGHDLLDDEAQADGFAALCGLAGDKPFECVGEVAESAAAMAHLAAHPAWRKDRVLRRLAETFPELWRTSPEEYTKLLAVRHPHRVPRRYREILDAGG